MDASEKVVQYLQEARANEDALVRVLQSQIAMTPAGSYQSGLKTHLGETQSHSERLSARAQQISGGRGLLEQVTGIAESLAGQTLALAKTPIDLLRGSGGEEKVLHNARDAAATEALEIATYTALERLAASVGDEQTAELARSIRADEQRMLDRILGEIPALTDAVVAAQLDGDPSFDASQTGAADTLRAVADRVSDTAKSAQDTARRTARQARKVPGVARAEGQVKGVVADTSDLAIDDYDDLTAAQINAKLKDLSQVDLAKVGSYERRHRDRKTVIARVRALTGDEPWPGYDELTVSDIDSALSAGDANLVRTVREYETAHQNRSGVVTAADKHLT